MKSPSEELRLKITLGKKKVGGILVSACPYVCMYECNWAKI